MKNVHPAAWVGLLLNFVLAYVLFAALLGLDISGLDGEERELVEALMEAVIAIRPLYYAMLAAQAVALGLIVMGYGFGLGLAMVAGFFMLPGSLVYIVGCALSHYRVKYSAFSTAPAGYAGAHFVFTGAILKKTRVLTLALLLSALACTLLGLVIGYNTYDMMLIFLGMALVGTYCMARARKNAALSLHDEHLTLCPALFASPILLPYSGIRQATLMDDGSIHFEIETEQGRKDLIWSLNAVAPEQRREALEELGAALTANNVPLY